MPLDVIEALQQVSGLRLVPLLGKFGLQCPAGGGGGQFRCLS